MITMLKGGVNLTDIKQNNLSEEEKRLSFRKFGEMLGKVTIGHWKKLHSKVSQGEHEGLV